MTFILLPYKTLLTSITFRSCESYNQEIFLFTHVSDIFLLLGIEIPRVVTGE